MLAGGMALGGHGERHNRMNELNPDERDREFQGSREFLESLGLPTGDGWSFCYPYGAFDDAATSAAASGWMHRCVHSGAARRRSFAATCLWRCRGLIPTTSR